MYELSLNQYNLIVTILSLAVGAMGVAAVFFFAQRSEVLPRYRLSLTLLSLVGLISAYNYYRLYETWQASFVIVNGVVRSTGVPYTDIFRYADWLLTVPLLLTAFVFVLDLSARQARLRSGVLVMLSVEMLALGYPGQIASNIETRWLWWGAAMMPFFIIFYQLYVGLAKTLNAEPMEARTLAKAARLVTVSTWSVYPVLFVLPLLGFTGSTMFIATEAGYAAADIMSKALVGVLICMAATSKSALRVEASGLSSAALRGMGVTPGTAAAARSVPVA